MGVSGTALIRPRANDNRRLNAWHTRVVQIAISRTAGSRRRRSPGSEVTTCCPVRRAQITTWASTRSDVPLAASSLPTLVASTRPRMRRGRSSSRVHKVTAGCAVRLRRGIHNAMLNPVPPPVKHLRSGLGLARAGPYPQRPGSPAAPRAGLWAPGPPWCTGTCQARELGAHDHCLLFQERYLILRELPDGHSTTTLFSQFSGYTCKWRNGLQCKR